MSAHAPSTAPSAVSASTATAATAAIAPIAPIATWPLRLAVIGAGPAGLTLALQAARTLPQAQISLFDARAVDHDVAGDPRTLALSLGSVQLLQRLGAWNGAAAQAILQVHISQ